MARLTKPGNSEVSRLEFAAAGETISEFLRRDDYVQTMIGPLGCMRASTLIQTESGLRRIDAITPGTRVVSWDDNQGRYRLSVSAGAHPKGEDCLYRVVTRHGEFVAAGHHRALIAGNRYKHVCELRPGMRLTTAVQAQSLNARVVRVWQRYARRYWKKAASWPNHCVALARQHGLLPLPVRDIAQELAPLAVGVGGYAHSCGPREHKRVDARQALERKRSQPCRYGDRLSMMGYLDRVLRLFGHRDGALAGRDGAPCSSRYSEANQAGQRSLVQYARRRTAVQDLQDDGFFSPDSLYASKRTIISVERLSEPEVFWDLEVEGTRNYVTADGTVHHNSAKTTSVICKLVSLWEKAPLDSDGVRRSRWVAVRNTYPDLSTTTIRDFLEIVDPLEIGTMTYGSPPTFKGSFVGGDGRPVEVEVFFIAFDLPQDVKKARGLRLSGAWFNEMKELAKSSVDMVMSRVGRYRPDLYRANPDAWYGCLGDSNAPDSDHWLAKLVNQKPKGWWFGIQPGAVLYRNGRFEVNPAAENLQNLAPGYYERMMQGKDEYWIRQNLGNEFVFYADGRAVHPSFSQRHHVSPYELEPTPGLEIALGFDFGRTPAGVVMQRQPNGQWWVLDEMVTENTSARPFAKTFVRELLNKKYEGFEYEATGDPSGGTGGQATDDTPFEMLSEGGIDAFPAHTNDFEVRTDALDRLLTEMIDGDPAILISPRCTVLIKALAGAYQFKRVQVSGMDRYHDKPVKDATSHVAEALHYGLMGAGEGEFRVSESWQKEFDRVDREYDGWSPPNRYFE